MFHVDSEVGRLRQVILHRPDLELKRLTPDNAADLLFDDVLWVSRAQAEHDAFADVLRSRGVVVHYYGDLLTQTLEIPEAREYILDRVFDPHRHGPLAATTLRAAMSGLEAASLARFLAGGITKRRVAELGPEPKSVAFTPSTPTISSSSRCRTCSTSGTRRAGSTAGSPSSDAPAARSGDPRRRGHLPLAPAVRPRQISMSGITARRPATIEGGDVLVIGNGAVLVGMSERTTPQAVEVLAQRLFTAGAARCLVAINMPKTRAFPCALDAVLTMAATGCSSSTPGMGMLPVVHGRAGRDGARAQGHRPPARRHAPRDSRRARPAGPSPR